MDIDPYSTTPAYRQLAAALRERIQAGEFAGRKPLPSLTTLKQETGLAAGTIQRAIGVLEEEGLVVVVPGRGTFAREP